MINLDNIKNLIEEKNNLILNLSLDDNKNDVFNKLRVELSPYKVVYSIDNKMSNPYFMDKIIEHKENIISVLKSLDLEDYVKGFTIKDNQLFLIKGTYEDPDKTVFINFRNLSTGTKELINLFLFLFELKDKEDVVLIIDIYLHTLLLIELFESVLSKIKLKTILLTNRQSFIDHLISEIKYTKNEDLESKILNSNKI